MSNLKIRKNIKALAVSSSLALLSLVGCSKYGNACTVREYMQSVDEFNLINSDNGENYKIIETENEQGETNINFVQVLSGAQLTDTYIDDWVFEDSKEYTKYGNASSSLYYINVFDGELVSVKDIDYIDKDEYVISYFVSNINYENSVYSYASSYLGSKDTYTREDMINLVELIKEDKAKEKTDKTLSLK